MLDWKVGDEIVALKDLGRGRQAAKHGLTQKVVKGEIYVILAIKAHHLDPGRIGVGIHNERCTCHGLGALWDVEFFRKVQYDDQDEEIEISKSPELEDA